MVLTIYVVHFSKRPCDGVTHLEQKMLRMKRNFFSYQVKGTDLLIGGDLVGVETLNHILLLSLFCYKL